MYLSFTGGPTLNRIERQYGSPMSRALYCSVDPELYYPILDFRFWILDFGLTDYLQASSILSDLTRVVSLRTLVIQNPKSKIQNRTTSVTWVLIARTVSRRSIC
jgi:hypothetical protein